MTIDDPASVVTDPLPIAHQGAERLRHTFGGMRQALFGIELTLLAILLVLVAGPYGLAGLTEALLAGIGLIAVLSGVVAESRGRPRSS